MSRLVEIRAHHLMMFMEEDYEFLFGMIHEFLGMVRERSDLKVVGLAIVPNALGKNRGWRIPLYYLRSFGLGTFLRLAMASIRNRIALRRAFLQGKLPGTTYQSLCDKMGIPLRRFTSPNSPEAVQWVKANQVDVLLVFVGHVLNTEIIQSAKLGVLNKHSSLLPAYRGLFPVFWAMKEGSPLGISVHLVNEAIDEGPLLLQEVCEWKAASVYDHYRKVYQRAPHLLMEALDILRNKKAARTVVHSIRPSYFSLPKRPEVREFHGKGKRFV